MIKLLFVFLLLFASACLGVILHDHPGYVLIAINQWTIESTVSIAILALIICFVILHALLLCFHWIAKTPQMWQHFRAKHRAQIASQKTRQGLIEFSEGHWLQAKNHLIKALPNAETPLLNYLTAARAAQEMGDSQLRDNFLREAQQSMPEAKIAVELTQAQLQLANKQWEQALATLRHLQDLSPRHPYVLKLLVHLYVEVKDWAQLIALLPELKRNHVVTDQELKQLEKQAYLQYILELIKQDQITLVHARIKALPKALLNDPEIISPYCRYLMDKKDYTLAESQLRHSIQKQFDNSLISLYGQIDSQVAQLKFAEQFLVSQPHSAPLNLCLGRLCKSTQLWGKAKQYIEASIELNETSEAYNELGKLLEHLHDEVGACKAYQKGLALALA